jgi:hypothetical protein
MKVRDLILVILFVSLATISLQEQVLTEVEADLGNHMIIEHLIFFSLGILSIMISERFLKLLVSSDNNTKHQIMNKTSRNYDNHLIPKLVYYWKGILKSIFLVNKYGFIWIIITIVLITIWHIPTIFDLATLYAPVHILQHVSFILVGACGFMALRTLGESFMLFALFSLIGMMGLSGLMFTLVDSKIYYEYSVSSHINAGNYMLISSIVLLIIGLPAYLIHRTFLHLKAK